MGKRQKKYSHLWNWKISIPVLELLIFVVFIYLAIVSFGEITDLIEGIEMSSVNNYGLLIYFFILVPFAGIAGLVISGFSMIFILGSISSLYAYFADRGKSSMTARIMLLAGSLTVPLLFISISILRGYLPDNFTKLYIGFLGIQFLYMILITVEYVSTSTTYCYRNKMQLTG